MGSIYADRDADQLQLLGRFNDEGFNYIRLLHFQYLNNSSWTDTANEHLAEIPSLDWFWKNWGSLKAAPVLLSSQTELITSLDTILDW